MKRLRFLGALIALVTLVACNDSGLPPGATYATVTGTVLDNVSKAPVSGATVTIDTVLTTTTDSSGKFSFTAVPSGDFDYVVQANGYKTVTASGHVDPNKTTDLAVALAH